MKNFAWIIFSSFLISCPWGFAQSPNALGSRNVQDYFQDVESKSYYQQERIRSMKGEMNEYSKRLHGLKEKFDKIFYGKSSDRLHKDPFGNRDKVSYPKRSYREPMPVKEVESIVRRPEKFSEQKRGSNQLAFKVDESGPPNYIVEQELALADSPSTPFDQEYEELYTSRTPNTPASISKSNKSKIEEISKPRNSHHRKGYFILRPGLTFSYKRKVTNYSNYPGKTKVREYKNGFSLLASGGFKFANGITLGGGAFHRVTKHDTGESYQAWPNQINFYPNGSESVSWGGFAELGYEYNLNEKIEFYSNIGLGYGVSITDKFFGKDVDDFVFATVGLGATWTPSDYFGLSLGYRYLHEEEVPAHAVELGLEGRF